MSGTEPLNSTDDAESEPSIDHAAQKRRIVMLLLGYSAILGIISCFLPEDKTPLDFLVGLPLLILGIMWCYTDAAQRNHRIGPVTKWLLILLFVVGMPVYLFQTRGLGGIKAIAVTMVLIAAMYFCQFATAFVTLYVGNVMGLWELA